MVHELQSNFINSVLAGVEMVTTNAGYDLIIAHSSESYKKETANANNLFHKRVDGLLASLAFDTEVWIILNILKTKEYRSSSLIVWKRV